MESLIAASKAGFAAHYDSLRSHLALDGMTPAQAADIEPPLGGGVAALVKIPTWSRTAKEI